MNKSTRLIYACSFLIAGAGFIIPFWPLCLVGLALASLSGRYLFAVIVGLLLDVAWGAPAGILHYVYFPFTIFALLLSLGYVFGARYFLDRGGPDTL